MSNPKGHPATLVQSHPGNTNHTTSGAFSRTGRVLAPRAEELTAMLMGHPHAIGLDVIAAEEIGSILAHIEALDRDLEQKGQRHRRTVLEHRARLTRELRTWLREFGGTPKARAEFAKELAQGGLAAEIARRRAQQRQEDDGD